MFELCGAAIFGVISGSLGTLALSESMMKSEQKAMTQELDEFMRAKSLDTELRRDIKDQLAHWLRKKVRDAAFPDCAYAHRCAIILI